MSGGAERTDFHEFVRATDAFERLGGIGGIGGIAWAPERSVVERWTRRQVDRDAATSFE